MFFILDLDFSETFWLDNGNIPDELIDQISPFPRKHTDFQLTDLYLSTSRNKYILRPIIANYTTLPIWSNDFCNLLEELGFDNFERIPVSIKNKKGLTLSSHYSLINNLSTLKEAVNIGKSDVEWLDKEKDFILSVKQLVLKNNIVKEKMIFELHEFGKNIIISETVKRRIEVQYTKNELKFINFLSIDTD